MAQAIYARDTFQIHRMKYTETKENIKAEYNLGNPEGKKAIKDFEITLEQLKNYTA